MGHISLVILCIRCALVSSLGINPAHSGATVDSMFIVLSKDNANKAIQLDFLNVFPSSFNEFYHLYSYDPADTILMFDKSATHILDGLANLNQVPNDVYFKKLIDIALDGVVEFGPPSYLHMLIRAKAKENPSLLMELLGKLTLREIYSFGLFFFNSLNPSDKAMPSYLEEHKEHYPTVYLQLHKAFIDTN
jgi:hypothetical protein